MAENQSTRIEKQCTITGCDLPHLANGMCKKHAQRVRRTGSPYRFCKKCDMQMPEDSGRANMCKSCKESRVCEVDGCSRPPQGRGWCKMHWKRWSKHGDPLIEVSRGGHNKKGPCLVSGCERKYHAGGYCRSHYYHFTKYGDPMAVGPGQHSGRDRMDSPTYDGMHKRIFYDRGRASAYWCVDCKNRSEEWSYDGGCPNELIGEVRGHFLAYSTDQGRYSPRCKSCHRKRDGSSVRIRDGAGRFFGTPDSARKIYADGDTPTGVHITVEAVPDA